MKVAIASNADEGVALFFLRKNVQLNDSGAFHSWCCIHLLVELAPLFLLLLQSKFHRENLMVEFFKIGLDPNPYFRDLFFEFSQVRHICILSELSLINQARKEGSSDLIASRFPVILELWMPKYDGRFIDFEECLN